MPEGKLGAVDAVLRQKDRKDSTVGWDIGIKSNFAKNQSNFAKPIELNFNGCYPRLTSEEKALHNSTNKIASVFILLIEISRLLLNGGG